MQIFRYSLSLLNIFFLCLGYFCIGAGVTSCGLIKSKFIDYRESTGTQVNTSSEKLKNCKEGFDAFNQFLAPVVSIKNCSCHALSPPQLTTDPTTNRQAFLAVRRSNDYAFLVGDSHPGKDFFKKLAQNDYNAWWAVETSKCGLLEQKK